jgi:glycosyltransferase involved in cell wall biosynthesis
MRRRVLLMDRGVTGNPHALGLAAGLRAHGLDVRIGGPAADPAEGMTAVFPRGDVKGHRIAKGASLPAALRRFRSLLEEFRPDIVHFNWPTPLDGLYRRWVRGRGPSAIVYTAHEPLRRGRYGKRQSAFLRDAHAVLVFGPTMREELLGRWPRLAGRVAVVPFGNYNHIVHRFDRGYARRELGMRADGAPLYVFVGGVRGGKGLETLLDAYANLKSSGGPGELLIGGRVEERSYLMELRARPSAKAPGIRWLVSEDQLDQRTLDLAASAADQVVLPLQTASLSASVIFAMTHGRCVVTTSVGEIPRVVEDRAILVPPGDPGRLREALRLASTDPERCVRLGLEAREHAETRLAWPAAAREVADVYELACRTRPS